jgi:probable phosphoglycerate mutase
LSRASETAKIIATELNLPVEESDELMERTAGELDGVPFSEFSERLKSEELIVEAGGESANEFKERVWNKFLEIVKGISFEGNVLIVAHGGVTRSIFAEILCSSLHIPLFQGNCCVNIIDYERERERLFVVELLNHTDHIV